MNFSPRLILCKRLSSIKKLWRFFTSYLKKYLLQPTDCSKSQCLFLSHGICFKVSIKHLSLKAVFAKNLPLGEKAQALESFLHGNLRLVPVPPSVTVFQIEKTIEEGATRLLSKLPVIALDRICYALCWLLKSEPLEVLLNRAQTSRHFFKAKSDYVTKPISEAGLEGLWKRLLQVETSQLILSPYGGKMSEISDSETPFPHRRGNIFKIQYLVTWEVGMMKKETNIHIGWMKKLYAYMAPYVSKSPRAAYLNYRDLDLGRNNNDGNTSYAKASIWGLKYFKSNFRRLVHVKILVDPCNFFRNEQSIPVFPSRGKQTFQIKLIGLAERRKK
ncbi:putative berberine/berberine [Rosa chinensis]|uniref:Putative berberine/berberine n=1 Tax=Rosa chinensis TaxID=74649 RepID=A0A2P6Q6H7_ROSCH|nr:putative berberine/berberine [Rosa chinensis]